MSTDMTVGAFCRKHGACPEGKKWAYGLAEKRSKSMMSELWEIYRNNPTIEHFQFFQWAINCAGVFSESVLRKMACRFIRETPLADGRKVWDLLTDERSKNAVIVAELVADGLATKEELAAANAAASAAARAAARAASWADARAASWADAWGAARDARDAAWDAAWAAAWDARDAAWGAARDARDAAWDARDAAWDAAWAAAWDASAAARAAARAAQLQIIFEYGNPWSNENV